MSYINYQCTFDGNDLTAITGLTVLSTNPYAPAKRKLNNMSLARSNKAKINSGFYDARELRVRVGITRATRDLLENSLDSLMVLLQGLEKQLVLRQAGASRTYTASYSDAVIDKDGGSYIELELIFLTSDHFGYDTASTLLTQISNFTSGNKTEQITIGGSAAWQQPTITYTLNSFTGTGSRDVVIGNGGYGMAVTVARTWTAGDVLEISAPNKTVKVNGVDVAFSGAIPEFSNGIGYLTYNDTFSARNMSLRAVYTKRYV